VKKRSHKNIQQYLRQHRLASIVTGHIIVAFVLGLTWLGSSFGPSLLGVFAQAACSSTDRTYVVTSGDTLSTIASRNNVSWQTLASHNQLANPNSIWVNEHICIPAHVGTMAVIHQPYINTGANGMAILGSANTFPYGQCTWWANQRFHQINGTYVPWTTNANAWQWSNRAAEFHWRVSSTPVTGAIVNLQPGVQGASSLGHVGVVEQILGNGHVIASNLNWGTNPASVANVEFSPGAGVTFITV
jgi:N-acetylmuramoyl-L-alanine amidase